MRRHLALPAAVLVAVLPLTAVGVAEADIQRFSDGRNDVNRTSDIHWVKIDNSTSNPNKVKVVVEQDELAPDLADTLQVFINTRADHRGPEYRHTEGLHWQSWAGESGGSPDPILSAQTRYF
jgi:hypothetical protein